MSNQLTTTTTNELAIAQPLPLDQHPAAVYLAGKTKRSQRVLKSDLDNIARLLGAVDCLGVDWGAVRYQHAAAIRTALTEDKKPATVNRMLSALRGVLKSAWLLGYMSAEDYHKAAGVKGIKNETLPAGRHISAGEIAGLMQACQSDESKAGARDAAILALLYAAGLRRAEIIGLDIADYETETGRLLVRGKGNKERIAWIHNGAARALAAWLAIRGTTTGAIFYAINKGDNIQDKRMTSQAIYYILSERAAQAGVKDFSPHDLRRTYITDLLEAGVDTFIVAKMAGHASPETTARYDRRPEAAKSKAAELLHVPYIGR